MVEFVLRPEMVRRLGLSNLQAANTEGGSLTQAPTPSTDVLVNAFKTFDRPTTELSSAFREEAVRKSVRATEDFFARRLPDAPRHTYDPNVYGRS